jgi:hypothetical protein
MRTHGNCGNNIKEHLAKHNVHHKNKEHIGGEKKQKTKKH